MSEKIKTIAGHIGSKDVIDPYASDFFQNIFGENNVIEDVDGCRNQLLCFYTHIAYRIHYLEHDTSFTLTQILPPHNNMCDVVIFDSLVGKILEYIHESNEYNIGYRIKAEVIPLSDEYHRRVRFNLICEVTDVDEYLDRH